MALRVWLPLNGTLENKGIEGVQPTAGSTTINWNNNGKIGKCFEPTGADTSFISFIAPSLANKKVFSIAFWLYPDSTSVSKRDWATILRLMTGSGTLFFCTGSATSATTSVIIANNENDIWTGVNPATSPNTVNQWNHITVVADGSKVHFYNNGVEFAVRTQSTGHITGDIRLVNAMTGKMNDLRIYDHALSPKEVKEISQGLVLHYKLDGFSGGAGENLLANSMPSNSTSGWSYAGTNWAISIMDCDITTSKKCIRATYTGTTQTAGGIHHPAIDWSSMENGEIYTFSAYLRASKNCTITFKNEMMTSATSGTFSPTITTEWKKYEVSGPINTSATYHSNVMYAIASNVEENMWIEACMVKLEKSSIATAYSQAPVDLNIDTTKITDSSGYGNDGTIIGTIITEQNSDRYGISVKNTAQHLSKTELNFPETKGLTFAFWTKINTWGHQTSGLFCTSDIDGNPSDYQTTAMNHRDSAVDLKVSGGSSYRLAAAPSSGVWHHCVFTHDGTNAKYYEDGVLKATNNSVSGNLVSFKYLYIGWSYAGGVNRQTLANWNDFRMYCTALSAEDILDLYHTPANIDNLGNLHIFELNEISQNLITITGLEQGGMTDANGQSVENANRIRTYYIPVLPNQTYKISVSNGHNIRGIHYYKNDTTWISWEWKGVQSTTFTTPANCYYIRIPFQNTDETTALPLSTAATLNPTLSLITEKNGLNINETANTKINKNGLFNSNHFSENGLNTSKIGKNGITQVSIFIEK